MSASALLSVKIRDLYTLYLHSRAMSNEILKLLEIPPTRELKKSL